MELWIRTQNRMRLFKISLDVSILPVHNKEEEIKHYMIGCNDYEMDYELGIYKTKERALEVLNEISDRIATLTAIELMGINDTNVKVFRKYLEENNCSVVYQMPKE